MHRMASTFVHHLAPIYSFFMVPNGWLSEMARTREGSEDELGKFSIGVFQSIV